MVGESTNVVLSGHALSLGHVSKAAVVLLLAALAMMGVSTNGVFSGHALSLGHVSGPTSLMESGLFSDILHYKVLCPAKNALRSVI